MQLRDYSSYFQPEEFDALTAAYDAAWQEMWAKRLTLTSEQVPVLKKNSVADHFSFRLQREPRRRAIERDCIMRSVRAEPRFHLDSACLLHIPAGRQGRLPLTPSLDFGRKQVAS